MKACLLLILFSSSYFIVNGQVLTNRIKKFALGKNIDSFLVYNYACNYCIIGDRSLEEPHYLFWQQDCEWYIKRFDYCQTFRTLQIDSLNPVTFYLQHQNEIDKEEVESPINKQTIKRKGRKYLIGKASPARFTCLHSFNCHAEGKSKTIIMDEYQINFYKYNNGMENVHYSSNHKNRLKALIYMTESLINKYNDENKFVAE